MSEKPFNNALDRSRDLCSRSEKCKSDIEAKLVAWGISHTDREKIIRMLTEEKFIDETRYATNYVNDKHRFNGWGKIKIRMMLKAKAIPADKISVALDNIDEDEYINRLTRELESKKKNTKASNQFDLKGKLLRYAASKGYEYDLIYKVIDHITKS